VPLELVTEFRYLGIIFQMNGRNFTHHVRERAASAIAALHGIKNLSQLSMTADMKLSDLKMLPILTYGIEIIWNQLSKRNLTDVESNRPF
jgi:hypothetical protein